MMEGSLFYGDFEITSLQTLVLVGRKGNGKSATGNNVLGTNVFRSERSSSGVTTTCEFHSTKLDDSRMITVIDTPGIFGSSVDTEFTGEEIVNIAGDGIHAFLVVFSIRSRFSKEEEAAISRLLSFFGSKIYDYMVLVFTGGDQLDKDNETLEDFLHDCPEKLQEILNLCENRCVLFDNKTEDQTKKSDQVKKLFSMVNMVSRKNGGKLYNNEIFAEWKKEAKKFEEEAQNFRTTLEIPMLTDSTHEGRYQRIFEMIEPKIKLTTMILERQLAQEQAARFKAEQDAEAIQKKSDEEICYMNEQIEIARTQKGPRKPAVIRTDLCGIL